MASFVQGRLKKVKATSKNVAEKYKEVLEQTLKDLKKPADLKIGLETFIGAGKKWCIRRCMLVSTTYCIKGSKPE